MAELIQRNVVIIPPREVWPLILEESQALKILLDTYFKGAYFTLSSKKGKPMPHVSLYQAAYPATVNQRMLEDTIEEETVRTKPFTVSMNSRMEVFSHEWIWWGARKTKPLVTLHNALVKALNPWRQGQLLPIHKELLHGGSLSKECKRSLRLFGNPLCKSTFAPHITLTRAKKPFLNVRPPLPSLTFTVDTLYLTTVGEHGTCPEILERFLFQG